MTAGKKLHYAPGMISLIGYLFLLPYGYDRSISKPVTVINFNVPKLPTGKNDYGYVFSEDWIIDDLKNKKKIRYWLDDDHETNQKKIDQIRFEARKIQYTLDSTSVILIEFTDDLFYKELFRIYDNCINDKIRRFATWDNYFIIFGGYPPRRKNNNSFDCFLCGDVVKKQKYPPKKPLIEKLSASIKPFNLLQISSLIILWLLMIFGYIYHRRKVTTTFFY